MEITDEFYSILNYGEVQHKIGCLGKETASLYAAAGALIKELLVWGKKHQR